jgi:hypothetical protein
MPFMPLSPDLSANFLKLIRLIASDMDGTFTKRGKFTPALLETLTQLAAIGTMVVTSVRGGKAASTLQSGTATLSQSSQTMVVIWLQF